MIRLAAIGVVSLLSAIGAVQAVGGFDRAQQEPAANAAVAQASDASGRPMAATAETQAAEVVKAADGHYWAEGDVNGSRVKFLVDTGASAVALTAADAQRLGFQTASLDYNRKVITANGEARAAQVKLASVSVAGARVADVDALIIDKGLETSLLGMTYLGRLSKIEATRSAMILRP
ncbi:MAG: TIGR02281 family clan AA aspartic protease [Caulobacteraceae bacterium]|nr:TIGR02281 family clan AA aspartic protease [Caulobacteraceae bacterium]